MCARFGRGTIDICLSEKGALAKKRLENTALKHTFQLYNTLSNSITHLRT